MVEAEDSLQRQVRELDILTNPETYLCSWLSRKRLREEKSVLITLMLDELPTIHGKQIKATKNDPKKIVRRGGSDGT